jgi:hypothetical protein
MVTLLARSDLRKEHSDEGFRPGSQAGNKSASGGIGFQPVPTSNAGNAAPVRLAWAPHPFATFFRKGWALPRRFEVGTLPMLASTYLSRIDGRP